MRFQVANLLLATVNFKPCGSQLLKKRISFAKSRPSLRQSSSSSEANSKSQKLFSGVKIEGKHRDMLIHL